MQFRVNCNISNEKYNMKAHINVSWELTFEQHATVFMELHATIRYREGINYTSIITSAFTSFLSRFLEGSRLYSWQPHERGTPTVAIKNTC